MACTVTVDQAIHDLSRDHRFRRNLNLKRVEGIVEYDAEPSIDSGYRKRIELSALSDYKGDKGETIFHKFLSDEHLVSWKWFASVLPEKMQERDFSGKLAVPWRWQLYGHRGYNPLEYFRAIRKQRIADMAIPDKNNGGSYCPPIAKVDARELLRVIAGWGRVLETTPELVGGNIEGVPVTVFTGNMYLYSQWSLLVFDDGELITIPLEVDDSGEYSDLPELCSISSFDTEVVKNVLTFKEIKKSGKSLEGTLVDYPESANVNNGVVVEGGENGICFYITYRSETESNYGDGPIRVSLRESGIRFYKQIS